MSMKAKLFTQYGAVKPGIYDVVKKEKDHYVIRWRGDNICIPVVLFAPDNRPVFIQRDEEDDDYDDYRD